MCHFSVCTARVLWVSVEQYLMWKKSRSVKYALPRGQTLHVLIYVSEFCWQLTTWVGISCQFSHIHYQGCQQSSRSSRLQPCNLVKSINSPEKYNHSAHCSHLQKGCYWVLPQHKRNINHHHSNTFVNCQNIVKPLMVNYCHWLLIYVTAVPVLSLTGKQIWSLGYKSGNLTCRTHWFSAK